MAMVKINLGYKGRRWVRFDSAGTDAISFAAFIESILESLPPGTPRNRKCFIRDNLLAHHNPLTLNAILAAGHRFVFRAPYYPVDGPIEYVFNTIEMALSYRMYDISAFLYRKTVELGKKRKALPHPGDGGTRGMQFGSANRSLQRN
eukprot:CAMPEP_0172378124 /NCGR_PEP_ID=MMETSP1060-20121228/69262_1 /TAXON_ID=37318 /ORGANISM="Pseudo-nitzschia pungens, Strain cf. cingulata" /LENGTH=146 /DNA_ID=CAMNT_0013105839 /DNA_START=815 /DNA_END=1256 /DNA_ORIENTATION=-